jgi:hypothetical protein
MGTLSVSVLTVGRRNRLLTVVEKFQKPAEARGRIASFLTKVRASNNVVPDDHREDGPKWKAPHFENGLPIVGAASISMSISGMKAPSR